MASDDEAVARFRAYLRMKTVHPSPTEGYEEAGKLFAQYASELGLRMQRIELEIGHPIFLLTWVGTAPQLPSIVLNSHMDVVPAEAAKWTRDPWGAELVDGKIYGRGTQDMKSVGMQYLSALARLRARGFTPLRTVHVLFVPDEEVGGGRGMKLLLGAAIMKSINAGLLLDEGLASPGDEYAVFNAERKIWWLHLRAEGPTGHGSRFVDGTAVQRLLRVVEPLLALREAQRAALEAACGCGKTLGDFTTLNLTMLHAGVHDPSRYQFNVIPTEAEAGFDIRIPVGVDLSAFHAQVAQWCADSDVQWRLVNGSDAHATAHAVSRVDGDDFWWGVFSRALRDAELPVAPPSCFPAATDGRWVRLLTDTPCFGFSPMRRTPVLLHDHDEFVAVDVFLEGIAAYEKLIPLLANAPPPPADAAAAAAAAAAPS